MQSKKAINLHSSKCLNQPQIMMHCTSQQISIVPHVVRSNTCGVLTGEREGIELNAEPCIVNETSTGTV